MLDVLPSERGLYNPAKLIKRARGGRSTNAVINCLSSKELYEFWTGWRCSTVPFADESVKEKPETVETLKQLGFTEEEIESPKALHKLKVIMLYPIVYLAAVTGMRLSELLALKWDNINFDDGTIMVYESSHYSTIDDDWGEPHHLNSTKEGKPKSFIELSDKDIEFLIQYRREQDERRRRYRANTLITTWCLPGITACIFATIRSARSLLGLPRATGLILHFMACGIRIAPCFCRRGCLQRMWLGV